MDASRTQSRPKTHDMVPSELGKSITVDIQRAIVRARRQKRRASVIGQNASMDWAEDDLKEMEHEDGARIMEEVISHQL